MIEKEARNLLKKNIYRDEKKKLVLKEEKNAFGNENKTEKKENLLKNIKSKTILIKKKDLLKDTQKRRRICRKKRKCGRNLH